MAGVTPTQQRTLDPFSDHRFTNTIHRFNRIVSAGNNLILPYDSSNDFSISITDPQGTVTIQPGFVVKDDIFIHIKEEKILDFDDTGNYVGSAVHFGPHAEDIPLSITHPHKYFILLSFDYQRTYPHRQASYVIAKNRNEFLDYRNNYIYLATATINEIVGIPFIASIEYEDVDENDGDAEITRPLYKYVLPIVNGGELD